MIGTAKKIRSRVETDENGCWVWQGAKVRKGYGVVHSPEMRRNVYTHRAMYEVARGLIPSGMQIDHLCRNPSCCNPDHLEAVTPQENTLRGLSPALAKARGGSKTHCKHGHEYTAANTYTDAQGRRSCKTCRSAKHLEWTKKRRQGSLLTATLPHCQNGNVL